MGTFLALILLRNSSFLLPEMSKVPTQRILAFQYGFGKKWLHSTQKVADNHTLSHLEGQKIAKTMEGNTGISYYSHSVT